MTRRRQLSHDCCIDLSPKVFVRRTSLTQIQQLVKGLKKVDDRVAECSQGTSEVKEENETKDKLGNTNGDETQKSNPIDHITPSQFNDANEIRRAISLNNIWKVGNFEKNIILF